MSQDPSWGLHVGSQPITPWAAGGWWVFVNLSALFVLGLLRVCGMWPMSLLPMAAIVAAAPAWLAFDAARGARRVGRSAQEQLRAALKVVVVPLIAFYALWALLGCHEYRREPPFTVSWGYPEIWAWPQALAAGLYLRLWQTQASIRAGRSWGTAAALAAGVVVFGAVLCKYLLLFCARLEAWWVTWGLVCSVGSAALAGLTAYPSPAGPPTRLAASVRRMLRCRPRRG